MEWNFKRCKFFKKKFFSAQVQFTLVLSQGFSSLYCNCCFFNFTFDLIHLYHVVIICNKCESLPTLYEMITKYTNQLCLSLKGTRQYDVACSLSH